jgi:hypothetical protein
MSASPANDNRRTLVPSIDRAVAGQALSLNQPHRKFGRCYAEFVRHCGDGKHVMVRKLISGQWKGRWTKPLKVERSLVRAVHTNMARGADQVAA